MTYKFSACTMETQRARGERRRRYSGVFVTFQCLSPSVFPSHRFHSFSLKLLGESVNYKAVSNCLANGLFIGESDRG